MANKANILGILRSLGYNDLLSATWYAMIEKWRKIYSGPTAFHQYTVYNGSKKVSCRRRSLGMAKKVCEDWSDLLLNEKVEITVSSKQQIIKDEAAQTLATTAATQATMDQDEVRQSYLDGVLLKNDFWVEGNQLMELVKALGTGAFVERVDGDRTIIDYIQAGCIYPLSWEGKRITECAFASICNDGKNGQRVHLSIHLKNQNTELYEVHNFMYDSRGNRVQLPEDVQEVWETGYWSPMFQILRPNIVNNIDLDCPMGISCYANAIDVLESVDVAYDSYYNEFVMGRKRIMVDDSAVKVDIENGEPLPVFDPKDTVFYGVKGLKGADGMNGMPVKEINMNIRSADHQQGLQAFLDALSEKVGFGKGYYKFEVDAVQTATGVVSQNSKLFRSVKKDEILLDTALTDLSLAVLFLGGMHKSREDGVEASISFDDSIIEDVDAIQKRALIEYQGELIDEVEYHMVTRGLEESAAIQFIENMNARSKKLNKTPNEPEPSFDGIPMLAAAQMLNGAQPQQPVAPAPTEGIPNANAATS